MRRFRVRLSPDALTQAQEIRAWWLEHRAAALDLFADELSDALNLLKQTPYIGASYDAAELRGMRRLRMPRTRYFIYYTVDDGSLTVCVHGIWHTARGQGPPLR